MIVEVPICDHSDCQEHGTVIRELADADHTGTYCAEHDPLTDPNVKEYWVAPNPGP